MMGAAMLAAVEAITALWRGELCFRLVMESTAGQPDVATPHGLGDGLRQRRLSDSG